MNPYRQPAPHHELGPSRRIVRGSLCSSGGELLATTLMIVLPVVTGYFSGVAAFFVLGVCVAPVAGMAAWAVHRAASRSKTVVSARKRSGPWR